MIFKHLCPVDTSGLLDDIYKATLNEMERAIVSYAEYDCQMMVDVYDQLLDDDDDEADGVLDMDDSPATVTTIDTSAYEPVLRRLEIVYGGFEIVALFTPSDNWATNGEYDDDETLTMIRRGVVIPYDCDVTAFDGTQAWRHVQNGVILPAEPFVQPEPDSFRFFAWLTGVSELKAEWVTAMVDGTAEPAAIDCQTIFGKSVSGHPALAQQLAQLPADVAEGMRAEMDKKQTGDSYGFRQRRRKKD